MAAEPSGEINTPPRSCMPSPKPSSRCQSRRLSVPADRRLHRQLDHPRHRRGVRAVDRGDLAVAVAGGRSPEDHELQLLPRIGLERLQDPGRDHGHAARPQGIRLVAGTGPSGRNGFKCFDKRFEQEEFPYDHSEYFDKGHMEAKWLPFLNRNEPHIPAKNTQVPRPDEGKPWPLYAVYLFLLCCFCAVGYMIATGKIGVRSWTQDSTVKQSLGEIRHITTPSFYQSSSDDDVDQNWAGERT